jgi:dimeric dUTPase (all-alpha-NTP-PPase superfamily)
LNPDRLEELFYLQEQLMLEYKKKKADDLPVWPVDITDKASQRFCRDITLRSVEELFEALAHLKNWKKHKKTEVKTFNRNEFLEEIVDSVHYLLELLVLCGITSDELYSAYCNKNKINQDRLRNGY